MYEAAGEFRQLPLFLVTSDLKVISANRSFYQKFRVSPEKQKDSLSIALASTNGTFLWYESCLEEIVPQNTHFNAFKVDHEFPAIGRRTMLLNARRIYRQGKGTDMILLAIDDITERKKMEVALQVLKLVTGVFLKQPKMEY